MAMTFSDLPDDLVCKILRLLSIKHISRLSSTNSVTHKASKLAIAKLRNISLSLYELDRAISIQQHASLQGQTYITVCWTKVQHRADIQSFLKLIWHNIYFIEYNQYELHYIMHKLHRSNPSRHSNKFKNIKLLSSRYLYQCHILKYAPFLHQLEWINIPWIGKRSWNTLITHCQRLRGISFDHHLHFDRNEANIRLQPAPALWTLSMWINDECNSSIYVAVINEMLAAAPNLKYLRLTGYPLFDVENVHHISNMHDNSDYVRKHTIKLPERLIALRVNFDCLVAFDFDISGCRRLCYVNLILSFLTEDLIEHMGFHQRMSKLLLSFLQIESVDQRRFFRRKQAKKYLGVRLEYENGTDCVSSEEKKAAIQQFQMIMQENDTYREYMKQYMESGNSESLQIISTNYEQDLVHVWSADVFHKSRRDIWYENNCNKLLYLIFAQMIHGDRNEQKQTLEYLKQFICLDVDV